MKRTGILAINLFPIRCHHVDIELAFCIRTESEGFELSKGDRIVRNNSLSFAIGVAACVLLVETKGSWALVITPFGTFNDCKSAIEFRDKELPKQLDAEFDRYKRGVQTRIDAAVKDFRQSLEKSKIDLSKATAAQRTEMSVAAGKYFASLLLSTYASNMKGPWKESYDKLTETEKKAVDVVIAKTDGMRDLTIDAVRGKQIEMADAMGPYVNAAITALSWSLGPVSKAVVGVVQGVKDTGLSYLEYKPDIDFAKAQSEFWSKQISDLIAKSPDARADAITAAKNAINKACAH